MGREMVLSHISMKVMNITGNPSAKGTTKMVKEVYLKDDPIPYFMFCFSNKHDVIKDRLKSWCKAKKIKYKDVIRVHI